MTVLVTRPEDQANELVELLKAEGIDAVAVPVVAYEPPEDVNQTKTQLANIQPTDTCIFISRQAVHGFVEYTESLPVCQVIAIGKGTADALESTGYENVIFPEKASSEGLLGVIDIELLKQNRVHIIRGGDGKETLFEAFQKEGVDVQYIETYRRRCRMENKQLLSECIDKHDIDLIVSTSTQLAEMLLELLDGQTQLLESTPMTTMSADMAGWAARHDIPKILPLRSGQNQRIVEQVVGFLTGKKAEHERQNG